MKILVADDSPVLRAAVAKVLEGDGFEVVAAEDGVEAITKFYEEQPDLVLLDVQMPKLIGYVVCRLIKEDPAVAHVPVLILTARDTEEDRYWGRQSGADGYLTKEALGDGLLSKVRSVLATRALSALNDNVYPAAPALGEADVLTRVCEMLDRKLFEATVINELTAIGTRSLGLRESISEVLSGVRRLVTFDAAAVVMLSDLSAYVSADPADVSNLDDLFDRAVAKVRMTANREVETADLTPVFLTRPMNVESGDEWGSFYAVPLRVRNSLVGIFLLAAHRGGMFTEGALRTLRAIEPAIASVVDSASKYQDAVVHEARSSLAALSGD